MQTGEYLKRLHAGLMAAKTIAQIKEIRAEIARVEAYMRQQQALEQQRQDPTGRLADLAYLKRAYDTAPTAKRRAQVARAAMAIKSESEHTRRLRSEMIAAKRGGDHQRARAIGEHLAL